MNHWPLLGVAWVVVGFALRLNPMLIVVSAGLLTGMLAGHALQAVLEMIGEAFIKQRYLALVLLTLPVIGMLERHGLRQHAQTWISNLKGATLSRLLISYLAGRQLLATLGLTSIGGHPQTVRPLLAPMAEGAASSKIGQISEAERQRLLGMCAATDNVGLFFGEDVFIAFGAVLLMQGFYAEQGIQLEPLQIAVWGIPTALCAFTIHSLRIRRFETQLRRATERLAAGTPAP